MRSFWVCCSLHSLASSHSMMLGCIQLVNSCIAAMKHVILWAWPLRGHCLHQFRSDRSHPVLLPLWESLVSQWGATHWKEIEWFEDGVWKSLEEPWRYDYCSGLARCVKICQVRERLCGSPLFDYGRWPRNWRIRSGRTVSFFLHFVLRSWRAKLFFLVLNLATPTTIM